MDARVLGGTSGIGAAIIERLRGRGIPSLAISNDKDTGRRLASSGQPFEFLDLSQSGVDVSRRTIDLLAQYGLPRYVFMSAGLTREEAVLETCAEDWLLLANVNLLGVVQLCNRIARAWQVDGENAWDRQIVILGSVNAMRPLPSQGAYSIMKAGLHAYAKCLSNDVAENHIRINLIAPGAVWTPMNETLFADDTNGEAQRRVGADSLTGRWGRAEEIAEVATWLALDSPPFLTGAELVVDGGYIVKR